MRTETITKNIYEYSELSDKAKEKVKEWYLEGLDDDTFIDTCVGKLEYLFPNSDLKIQYSLASCQGDGLNIYGTIEFTDLLNNLKDKFSEEEINRLNGYFEYEYEYKLAENRYNCYCTIDMQNITENLIEELDWKGMNYDKKLIEKFNKFSNCLLCELCSMFERDGYEYFYEISDDELEEFCSINDYEFLEDGTNCIL